MMSREERMLIVGGGQCGARAAHTLRTNGWNGAITLVGNEASPPYERPPLSKAVLTGECDSAHGPLYGATFYEEQRIETLFGRRACTLDRVRRTVSLDDGRVIGYTRLLLATGATPRTLDVPGRTLNGIHTLRTDVDADRIAQRLLPGRRIAIVGAGFIGLEVAASAIARGCDVVVLEAAPRALMRAVPAPVAQCIIDMHRSKGVDVRFGASIVRFVGEGHVSGIELAGREVVACDTVIVGIGVTPCTELAQQAGLDVMDGIVVDEHLRTSDTAIFAAGDACSFVHPLFGKRIRLECWKNAEDQARIAASNMLGHNETCNAVPWFWSDHYDMTVQIAGLPSLGETTLVRETGPAARIFFALSADGVVVGASGVGPIGDIAKEIRISQELIAKQARPAPAALMDRSCRLRALMTVEAQ
jgi:3-phenylpropionate/trans-cinnamate dioxygenase ferredoxin reductase component